jgi:hypothetical protein
MKLFLIILAYGFVNFYLCRKVILWFSKFKLKKINVFIKTLITIVYLGCFLSVVLGYALPNSSFQRAILKFSNYFTGVMFYMLLAAIISDLIILISVRILKKDKNFFYTKKYICSAALVTIILVGGLSLYGFIHATDIKTTKYSVVVKNKEVKEKKLKVVLVADMHLGYSVGYKMMDKMVAKINKENPDLVLIAGDIFDNSYDSMDKPDRIAKAFKSIKSKYGTYAVFGNHDVKEKLFAGFSIGSAKKAFRDDRMNKMLEDANIKILDDKVEQVEDFYIIGRKDYSKAGDGTKNRLDIEELVKQVDQNKFVIVLEHEPKDLENISNNKVDLHVAGHTHAGQFFPLTIGTEIIWKNNYGLLKVNDMTSIVTSGVGVYGPNMRVGTDSEVVVIDVNFK